MKKLLLIWLAPIFLYAQLTGDGYVSLIIDEALHDKLLMGYVTNGYVDGEASLTIFSVDSIMIE